MHGTVLSGKDAEVGRTRTYGREEAAIELGVDLERRTAHALGFHREHERHQLAAGADELGPCGGPLLPLLRLQRAQKPADG